MTTLNLPPHRPLVLAFDSGSPFTSVAVARGGDLIAEDAIERASGSESLLATIDDVLARARADPRAIGAICVLRGPGSFTGLRIGLATALGLHQALGVPVAAMPTLRVLAEAGPAPASTVVAIVDALRGQWFAQAFRRGRALEEEGPPRILDRSQLRALAPAALIGFGASRLAEDFDLADFEPSDPPPLAGVAARLAWTWPTWDPALLTQPLYLRPAPATHPPPRP